MTRASDAVGFIERRCVTRVVPRKGTAKRSRAKRPRAKKPVAKRGAGGSRVTGLKKAEGEAPVRAYFTKVSPEHRAIGLKLDTIIDRHVPGVRRALKWSTPLWGIEGRGWFCAFGSFKNYAKVNFFKGAALRPPPPEGEGKEMRGINIASLAEFDDAKMTSWVRQAARIPGWGK